jgi:hypothetical protein
MTRTGVSATVEKRGGRPAIGCGVILTLLMWSGVYAAEVQNSSFETTYMGTPFPRLLPQGWWHVDHASFNSYCTSQWSTNGTLSAALLSRIGRAVSRGNYQSFYQYVDLTGIGTIEFDVRMAAVPEGAFEHFEASFLVDGVPLWSQDAAGVYLDQKASVAGMAGWHRIEMRNTAVDAGTFSASYSTQWDNVRLIEGQVTIPAIVDLNPSTLSTTDNGTSTLSAASNGSGTLNPASNGKWITCHIELGADYDVNAIDGASVTLNDIPAYMGDQGWATPQATAANVADDDGDGVLERMVKFDRAAVQAIVQPPETTVTVKGRLVDGPLFEGTAVVCVPDKKGKKD